MLIGLHRLQWVGASGKFVGVILIIGGVWWGKEPFETYTNKVGRFMSEYGFQAMPSELTLHSMGLNLTGQWTMRF